MVLNACAGNRCVVVLQRTLASHYSTDATAPPTKVYRS